MAAKRFATARRAVRSQRTSREAVPETQIEARAAAARPSGT